MNAEPLLKSIARALRTCKLEAILVGNAGAALQGAPVTTVDMDFMFRKTSTNLRKLKELAQILNARIFQPFYPSSEMYRIVMEQSGWQIDFLARMSGVRSFEGLRARAATVEFAGCPLMVASLEDIYRSKKAAARPKDMAVLWAIEKTLHEKREKK